MTDVTITGNTGLVFGSNSLSASSTASKLDSVTQSGSTLILNAISINNRTVGSEVIEDGGTTRQLSPGTVTISENIEDLVCDSSDSRFSGTGLFGNNLTVASGVYIRASSTSNAAVTVPANAGTMTITNSGYILGHGGDGQQATNGPFSGGPAIEINATGNTITVSNSSGAYIAGGGGGGGAYSSGGGAGGGDGGQGYFGGYRAGGPGSDTPGGTGTNGAAAAGAYNQYGRGGSAGGGGGGYINLGSSTYDAGGGGGGGWAVPGTGGGSGYDSGTYQYYAGGTGGSAGNAGGNAPRHGGFGGGGGWGASGGGTSGTPGSGGKAIEDNGISYTLSNSGTIYGTT